jgi:S1-C subfamily serine protease
MRLRKFLSALLLALFTFQTLQFTAFADEGMWTFNNAPRAEIKKKYGFDVTDEWLNNVRMASVRFNNGGSGSFVSPNGLVLTNYHIVEDIVGDNLILVADKIIVPHMDLSLYRTSVALIAMTVLLYGLIWDADR